MRPTLGLKIAQNGGPKVTMLFEHLELRGVAGRQEEKA